MQKGEELQCVDFTPNQRDHTFFGKEDIECFGLNELPLAVAFQCGPGRSCPAAKEAVPVPVPVPVPAGGSDDNDSFRYEYLPLNRKCTAKTTNERFFSCYEISPQTDLAAYFSSYAAETEDLQAANYTCADITNEDENEFPRYDYANRVYYAYRSQGILNIALYANGLPSSGRSDVFNATLAEMAIIVQSDLLDENHDDKEGFPRCAEDGGCGYDEFGGIEHTCHFRNCENFYDFGPTQFTGNKTEESSPEGLSCFVDTFPEDIIPPCASVNGAFPTLVHLTCQPRNIHLIRG